MPPREMPAYSFARDAEDALSYPECMIFKRESRYLGHNPLGASKVIALLAAPSEASVQRELRSSHDHSNVFLRPGVRRLTGNRPRNAAKENVHNSQLHRKERCSGEPSRRSEAQGGLSLFKEGNLCTLHS